MLLIGIPPSSDELVLSKLACRRARRLCPDPFMTLLTWPALARRALGRRRWTLRSISNMLSCDCKAPGREMVCAVCVVCAVCASGADEVDTPFSTDESCRPASAVEGGIFGPIFSWDDDLHPSINGVAAVRLHLKKIQHNKPVKLFMARRRRRSAKSSFFVHPAAVLCYMSVDRVESLPQKRHFFNF